MPHLPGVNVLSTRSHFYQSRSAWSMDQGSTDNHSPVNNFAPTVTKFCVMWEGLSLPHDTKFGNCRDEIVDSRAFSSWSLIHGSSWSGLIKVEPGMKWEYKNFNSLWPSDAIWQQRSGSTLVQVMAWCRQAPSHYLNQCWLILSKVQWHSSDGNFIRDTTVINH